jgi:GNAT superfamily N-acetyltransferase
LPSGERTGAIGHYAAVDAAAGAAVLERGCALLATAGAAVAVGPMDGTTWRRYRFIVDRGHEPVFFLEPDNPDEWPVHWSTAGFTTLATYTSASTDDLGTSHPDAPRIAAAVADAGIVVRVFDPSRRDDELRRIFDLSLRGFAGNFLYTPIAETEFLAQYHAVLPHVRPELVLMAERGDELVGFMFAVPNLVEARAAGRIDSVILKTLAVSPSVRGIGLGTMLLARAQHIAHELGFRRAIHALIHEHNLSRRISDHFARTIRRYALFQRRLLQ